MRWQTVVIGSACAGLLLMRYLAFTPPKPSFDLAAFKNIEQNIDWTKQKLTEVQEDPKISQILAKLRALPRPKGCLTEPVGFSGGFNASQWLEFKRRNQQPGLEQEKVLDLLGAAYCPVSIDAIRRKEYKKAMFEERIKVVRWLPSNDLSQTNVLDVYFQNGRVLTFDLYQP